MVAILFSFAIVSDYVTVMIAITNIPQSMIKHYSSSVKAAPGSMHIRITHCQPVVARLGPPPRTRILLGAGRHIRWTGFKSFAVMKPKVTAEK